MGKYGEPWRCKVYPAMPPEIDTGPGTIPIVAWSGFDNSDMAESYHVANASRIVACVNALASMPDPAKGVERLMRIEKAAADFLYAYDCEWPKSSLNNRAMILEEALRACGEEVEGG